MRRRAVLARVLACMAAVLAAPGPVAEATMRPRPSGAALLVLARPGGDAAALAVAAGAELVGRAGPAALVRDRAPDLALRLWGAGAVAVSGDPRLLRLVGP